MSSWFLSYSLIRYFFYLAIWFCGSFFRYEILETSFLHKIVNRFSLCQETCAYAKLTGSAYFKNWFRESQRKWENYWSHLFGHVTLIFDHCSKLEKWSHKSSSLVHEWELFMTCTFCIYIIYVSIQYIICKYI